MSTVGASRSEISSIFPPLKPISLENKNQIIAAVNQYPPYSDFNFSSLLAYNTENDALFTVLNNNLVIRIRDYVTNKPFYSFLGKHKVNETASSLLIKAQEENIEPMLKLIPEDVIRADESLQANFSVREDRDNFDYIMSAKKTSELTGSDYTIKRKLVKRFNRESPQYKAGILDITNPHVKDGIMRLFDRWGEIKGRALDEIEHESIALKRLLDVAPHLDLLVIGVTLAERLVGYTVCEIAQQNFAVGHFAKADTTYKGLFEKLYQTTAQELLKRGCRWINFEQDLGIPGLRTSKELWNPVKMLKKYTISKKLQPDSGDADKDEQNS